MPNNVNDNGGLIVAYSQANDAYVVSAPHIGWYTIFHYAPGIFKIHLGFTPYDVQVDKSSKKRDCPSTQKAAQAIADDYTHLGDDSNTVIFSGNVNARKNSPTLNMTSCVGVNADLTTFAKAVCFAQRCFLAVYQRISKKNLDNRIARTKSELKLNAQQANKLQTKLKHLQARRKD